MEYSKIYFARYLASNPKTRKESKAHWIRIFFDSFANGEIDELAAAILAVIAIADNMIETGK